MKQLNYRQIDVIENEVISELMEKTDLENIGVISPYRNQKKEMEKKFNDQLKIDTIHKFQGSGEKEILENKIREIFYN